MVGPCRRRKKQWFSSQITRTTGPAEKPSRRVSSQCLKGLLAEYGCGTSISTGSILEPFRPPSSLAALDALHNDVSHASSALTDWYELKRFSNQG